MGRGEERVRYMERVTWKQMKKLMKIQQPGFPKKNSGNTELISSSGVCELELSSTRLFNKDGSGSLPWFAQLS